MKRSEIARSLEEIAARQWEEPLSFQVRRCAPADFGRGVYASNIAHVLAAKIGSDPNAVADKIEREWPHRDMPVGSERGFLNFRMSDDVFTSAVRQALEQGRDYGTSKALAGRRVNVEYVSADPTGPLTLQHARIAATGDALCRLLEGQGAVATREYFLNDNETSSKLKLLGESVAALYQEAFGRDASPPEGALRDSFTRAVARDLAAQSGNSLLLLPEGELTSQCAHQARETAVEVQKQALRKFGSFFDVWTSESALSRDHLVENVLAKLRETGHSYEKNGVVWLASTKFGDEADRPLVRADGYTYLAADIAYHAYRFERSFDLLFNIWTGEHRQYVARTHAALAAAGFPEDKLEVLICEDVTLLRDGEPVQVEEGEPSLDDALEEIEPATLRFILLLEDAQEPLRLEIENARRDDESNPGYAARLLPSRLGTLLRQAEAGGAGESGEAEKQLARFVALWPDELEMAAQDRCPQKVARFVLEMSDAVRGLAASGGSDVGASPETLRAALTVAENALRSLNIEPQARF